MLTAVERVETGTRARPEAPAQQNEAAVAEPGPARTLWFAVLLISLLGITAAIRESGLPFSFGPFPDKRPVVLPHQLPYGKGMWIWQPSRTEGGDAKVIVGKAHAVGLTHIFVRTGDSWSGFYAAPFLNEILPVAHDAGIRVYGWDFPTLADPAGDVIRATEAIAYVTSSGHRLDGFAPDIETWSEGTQITPEAAMAYADGLQAAVAPTLPLIAVVPRPSEWNKSFYPFVELIERFDAVAPMVYWLNREPGPDVEGALADLNPLGKPVFPIGQAYDGGPEGGRWGVPPREELLSFMSVAGANGAQGVSFWSWQAADEQAWEAIRDAPEFRTKGGGGGRSRTVVLQAG